MNYDDRTHSCLMCSVGLEPQALCDCNDEPMCWRCHQTYHVDMAARLRAWGSEGGVA